MNRLQLPSFFDDHAALRALAKNWRVASYPSLSAHTTAILDGYTQYVTAKGNAALITKVSLPPKIEGFLQRHYDAPPKDIGYISEIRNKSGANTCPMCGSMHCNTLDHILPKTKFPSFAIFGLNLVPACNCNSWRGQTLLGAHKGERILHPYFDDILGQRLVSARFDDLGEVPSISLQLLLSTAHPLYSAVSFHTKNVVEKTLVKNFLRKLWVKLIQRPGLIIYELSTDPPTRNALVEILNRERERLDDLYDSKNNWHSIFLSGLLVDEVIDWLFQRFSRPGRSPNDPLAS